jgi:hypothetical protein
MALQPVPPLPLVLQEVRIVVPTVPTKATTPGPTAPGWWWVNGRIGYAIGFALVLGMIVSAILTSR